MPVHRSVLTTVCLAGSLTLGACASEAPSDTGPLGPSALQPSSTAKAVLLVQVDAICAGQESNIRVFVDLAPIGVTNPGDPGVSETVTVGSHQLSAVSQRGTQWGPFPTTVSTSGQTERLGCMPPIN